MFSVRERLTPAQLHQLNHEYVSTGKKVAESEPPFQILDMLYPAPYGDPTHFSSYDRQLARRREKLGYACTVFQQEEKGNKILLAHPSTDDSTQEVPHLQAIYEKAKRLLKHHTPSLAFFPICSEKFAQHWRMLMLERQADGSYRATLYDSKGAHFWFNPAFEIKKVLEVSFGQRHRWLKNTLLLTGVIMVVMGLLCHFVPVIGNVVGLGLKAIGLQLLGESAILSGLASGLCFSLLSLMTWVGKTICGCGRNQVKPDNQLISEFQEERLGFQELTNNVDCGYYGHNIIRQKLLKSNITQPAQKEFDDYWQSLQPEKSSSSQTALTLPSSIPSSQTLHGQSLHTSFPPPSAPISTSNINASNSSLTIQPTQIIL